jgi:hypothetical protein
VNDELSCDFAQMLEGQTLNPKPFAQMLEGQTLNPKTFAQMLEGQTLNPKPFAQMLEGHSEMELERMSIALDQHAGRVLELEMDRDRAEEEVIEAGLIRMQESRQHAAEIEYVRGTRFQAMEMMVWYAGVRMCRCNAFRTWQVYAAECRSARLRGSLIGLVRVRNLKRRLLSAWHSAWMSRHVCTEERITANISNKDLMSAVIGRWNSSLSRRRRGRCLAFCVIKAVDMCRPLPYDARGIASLAGTSGQGALLKGFIKHVVNRRRASAVLVRSIRRKKAGLHYLDAAARASLTHREMAFASPGGGARVCLAFEGWSRLWSLRHGPVGDGMARWCCMIRTVRGWRRAMWRLLPNPFLPP